jgi:hypothetical protein
MWTAANVGNRLNPLLDGRHCFAIPGFLLFIVKRIDRP